MNKTRSRLTLCFAAVATMLASQVTVWGQDFTFTTNNGTITITGFAGTVGAGTITPTINGFPVTSIGDSAFFGCISLTSVTIPASVTNIGESAFEACTSLTTIMVNAANSAYSSVDGVLFDKSQTTLIAYPAGRTGGYTIPQGVTTIGVSGFGSPNLTYVRIPSSVTNMVFHPLAFCENLLLITVDLANVSYSSLDGVLFNKSQTILIQYPGGRVGEYAVPKSVISIGEAAFAGCENLTSITLPSSVTTIGVLAFGGQPPHSIYCCSESRQLPK